MQALALEKGGSENGKSGLPHLSLWLQIVTGVGVTILLAGSFILSQSLIPFAVLLGALAVFATIRNPVASLFAFVIINVVLLLHNKEDSATGAPGAFDLSLGLVLTLIMAYWLIRIRLFERDSLSFTGGQLAIAAFALWSLIVTTIGLTNEHNSLNNALREMLNLSPLLILPIIYSHFVKNDSREEWWLCGSVLLAGLIMVAWNFYRMRSNVLRAYYLYQMGRANSDEMLSALLVFVATSILMNVRGFRKALPAMLLFMIGMLGVVISFARTLYIVVIICVSIVIFLGSRRERWRGIRRIVAAGLAMVAGVIPFYLSSRVIRLMLLNYGLRLLSAQHLGTDISLVARYTEWKYEWQNILHSPILGYGFGTQFLVFDYIKRINSWTSFSHSSYLYIIFKTGFIGAALFFGAYIFFLIKGFFLLRSHHLNYRTKIILRAVMCYLVGILIYSYTAPVLNSKTDLIWVGLIWGYLLVLERRMRFEERASSSNSSSQLGLNS